ncbi:hypothetical protein GCM10009754_31360 [Amycolatopsis minnesotensis]|uniref:Uncharacterized protein n=2 Tax=Amycolatopsis minnesotensis TaxID=337894 RepID=A0ABP5C8J2_9PSEU
MRAGVVTVRLWSRRGRTVRVADVPSWVRERPDVPERMVTLVYRVGVGLGRSPRGCARLCSRVLVRSAVLGAEPSTRDEQVWIDPGRRVRTRVVVVLRADLGARIDLAYLDSVVRDAIFLDEMALLPPRQRLALWMTTLGDGTVPDIVARTGWTTSQTTRLLRTALQSVTAHSPG